ncbi:FecR family protein [Pinibacter aurantiacus]|uniref:DUF4974 domain-containing protein n=1 Tax=Pinibacter aurantiacus TaxID=2851599 RepID=A0A9E2W5P0_9BACT|nr:FecR family protein [Pinibacter aurantiacus]MBV4359089.1 DUF4974 domain-containing protein [Pinibacter aurantiacus]
MNYQFQETEEKAQRIAYLVAGFINKTLTTKEHDELDEWVGENDDNTELFAQLTDKRNIDEAMAFMTGLNKDKAYKKIKSQLFTAKKIKWLFPVSIAAIVLIAFGIGWLIKSGGDEPQPEKPDGANETAILPGFAKATLQLANGRTIELGPKQQGKIANQNGVEINGTDQTITYSGEERSKSEAAFNTLIVPKGGKYVLKLSDGTTVWLNAASSIKYPVAFTGNERKVVVEGEAFFDIAKNEQKPFIVQTSNQSIKVLGTSFNVSTYIDEPSTQTTLVSGKIKVIAGGLEKVLTTGEQACVNAPGNIEITKANLREVTAWKEDQFLFKNQPIENIMRQLARWYDVKVVYKSNINYHFNAAVPRKEPLLTILQLLQQTGHVHFAVNGTTVEVGP